MSKYSPLKSYLQSQAIAEVPMSFSDVEAVLGFRLPNSAYRHRPWWANETEGHVHAQAWLEAGYETAQVDMAGRKLVYRRIKAQKVGPRAGVEEQARMFTHEENMPAALKNPKPRHHPAWGALKGTFTIAPDWDITKPALDPEELAEWEANLDRMADELEQHRDSGKK